MSAQTTYQTVSVPDPAPARRSTSSTVKPGKRTTLLSCYCTAFPRRATSTAA